MLWSPPCTHALLNLARNNVFYYSISLLAECSNPWYIWDQHEPQLLEIIVRHTPRKNHRVMNLSSLELWSNKVLRYQLVGTYTYSPGINQH